MAGNQTANFVVKAKDQATGPLGKIGTSMGKLRKTGVSAFKGIAAASAVAAAAPVLVEISILSPGFNDNNSLVTFFTFPLDVPAFVFR